MKLSEFKSIYVKSKETMIELLQTKYKNHGWSLIKTKKIRPFGYIGYLLTIYGKEDDITPVVDLQAKTLQALEKKLRNHYKIK